jgi:hypothetical protein
MQTIACWTIERLMRRIGIEGARRSKKVYTSASDTLAPWPLHQASRQLKVEQLSMSILEKK